ncbi:MAG: hypothetical protein H7Y88_02050 [Phycisphaerales bacterium]|nr:hypothetical protein [Phycisphaerales bacterium]
MAPVAGAAWTPREIELQDGRILELKTAPATDDSGQQMLLGVLGRPAIASNPQGAPAIHLTVVLERQPDLAETDVTRLVRGGRITLGLESLPTSEQTEHGSQHEAMLRPLFVARTVFELRRPGDGGVLAQQVVEGSAARGALDAALSKEEIVAALGALQGRARATAIMVSAAMQYVAVGSRGGQGLVNRGSRGSVSLRLDYQTVGEGLERLAAEDRVFYGSELRAYLTAMVESGEIEVVGSLAAPEAAIGESFRRVLMALSPILSREGSGAQPADPVLGERYRLAASLPEGSITVRLSQADARTVESVEVSAPLERVLAELPATDIEKHQSMVWVGADGVEHPVIAKMPARRAGPEGVGGASGAGGMMARRDGVVEMKFAMRPSSHAAVSPHLLMASDAVAKPQKLQLLQAWHASDAKLELLAVGGAAQSLPVIDAPDAPMWNDRVMKTKWWYAPVFEVARPDPAKPVEQSPFLFEFKVLGHGANAEPVIEATVKVTLREKMSDKTVAAWEKAGKPELLVTPALQTSVQLVVPYRDGAGALKREAITATEVVRSGDTLTATFMLANDWARLAYGAIATAGFQPEPAQVLVGRTFRGYRKSTPGKLQVLC